MTVGSQMRRLEELGVPNLAGITAEKLHAYARPLAEEPNTVLAVHPSLVPAHRLAPLLSRNDKPGFVVADLIDLDQFADREPYVTVPDRPLYLLIGVDRGDDMRNWSPDELCRPLSKQRAVRSLFRRASPGCCKSPRFSSRTSAS